jgi:uncharacterized repeat protein (TIGR03803 family)
MAWSTFVAAVVAFVFFSGVTWAAGDGASPSGLIAYNGALYGVTGSGGANSAGTVFSITPDGVYKQVYAFTDP